MALNDIDKTILNHLQADSSISIVELARKIKLSQPATHARIKRLEEATDKEVKTMGSLEFMISELRDGADMGLK